MAIHVIFGLSVDRDDLKSELQSGCINVNVRMGS